MSDVFTLRFEKDLKETGWHLYQPWGRFIWCGFPHTSRHYSWLLYNFALRLIRFSPATPAETWQVIVATVYVRRGLAYGNHVLTLDRVATLAVGMRPLAGMAVDRMSTLMTKSRTSLEVCYSYDSSLRGSY